jgi:hypothetical protein
MGRAVLTLATGKPAYVRMAVNLARSFAWWHRDAAIRFSLATDQPERIPADLAGVEVITLKPGQFGSGFSPKLHLDRLAIEEQTLFVDADCLCVGALGRVFDLFAGHAVSVVGGFIADGEWFGDVASVCRRFGVSRLPKFNGGIYYLEKGAVGSRVYATARELQPRYDEIGLVRLRGQPNDELLLAIAMALHRQTAIPDDGTILSDPHSCPGELRLDVLAGGSRLINPPPPHPQHRTWNPLGETRPVLVHFLGGHTAAYPYRREELRLELARARGWPVWAANCTAAVVRSAPLLSVSAAKRVLRPAYHRLFGPRAVMASDRA